MKGEYIGLLAIITPLLAFFGVKYVNSGDINHSTAADLWTASQEIRKELREEVTRLKEKISELEECCEKTRRKIG